MVSSYTWCTLWIWIWQWQDEGRSVTARAFHISSLSFCCFLPRFAILDPFQLSSLSPPPPLVISFLCSPAPPLRQHRVPKTLKCKKNLKIKKITPPETNSACRARIMALSPNHSSGHRCSFLKMKTSKHISWLTAYSQIAFSCSAKQNKTAAKPRNKRWLSDTDMMAYI